MLDLIEYLARWVRGPALIVCLARDELLDRRPGWGGGRRNATTIALEPLSQDETRAARRRPAPRRERQRRTARRSWSPRSPSAPAATRCSPRRWSTGSARRDRSDVQTLPETVHAVLAARLDSLSRARAPRPPARLGRRPDLLGGLAAPASSSEEGIDLAGRAGGAAGEGPGRAERGQPAGRASTSTPSSTC